MGNADDQPQGETLEPNVHALTVLVCQDCIDLKGEMCNNPQCVFCRRTMVEVQRYLDVMLLCPIVDGKRLILVGDAATNEDARAAVAGPRSLTPDEERDVEVVFDLVSKAGRDADGRRKLTDAICDYIASVRAATSSPAPAESESPILAFDKWLMRYVADHGKLTQQEYGIAYAAFIAAHPGEGPLARTMNAALRDLFQKEGVDVTTTKGDR